MTLRFLLPSAIDLALTAATCTQAVLMWVCDTDLILRAMAGQLVPFTDALEGVSLPALRGPDHPSTHAAHRALAGEVVPYTCEVAGKRWRSVVAPLYAGRRIIGTVANSRLDVAEPAATTTREAPIVFQCVRDTADLREGDIVTVRTRHLPGIRINRALPQRRLDVNLATGALIPVPHDDAYASEERRAVQAARAVGRDVPHLRAPLRLLQG